MKSLRTDSPLWPTHADIESALRSVVGNGCRLVAVVPLGARSLRLDSAMPAGPKHFGAYRQRSPNTRHNLPLSEEAALLNYLTEHLPERSIQPLYFCPSFGDGQEPFLLVDWEAGVLLGERLEPRTNHGRIQRVLKQELDRLHRIGFQSSVPNLSRVTSLDNLFRRAQRWNPALWGIRPKTWSLALTRLEEAVRSEVPSTLLHGDAHAYNLLYTRGKYCWLDYEYAAIGPPEIDHARLDVLLMLQAECDIGPGSDETPLSLSCRVFMAGEFLLLPPPNASAKAIHAVQNMLRGAVDRLCHPSYSH